MEITPIDYILFGISFISIVSSIYLFSQIKNTKKMQSIFYKDIKTGNVEEILKHYISRCEKSDKEIKNLEVQFKTFVETSKSHFQKMAFKRFNPFQETGGDQSFILVLLDKINSGFIITSLHQRDVTRVYSREVIRGDCKQKLLDEERKVLGSIL